MLLIRDVYLHVLKKSQFTIAEAFKEAGYTTFFAGKWHLAGNEVYPEDQGFDYNYGGGHAGAPRSYFQPYNIRKNGNKGNGKEKFIQGLDDAEEGYYLTDHLTDKTVEFIKEHKDKPFFVYLSHYGVHTPFESKEELKVKYDQKLENLAVSEVPEFIRFGDTGQTKTTQNNSTYAGMIESVDESFGRITTLLKKLNLEDNTIIVFTSDHGGLSNRGNKRPLATSNLPLRAGKGHNYEGGIRIPMFVKWPGVTKGEDSDYLVTGTDYFPTLLEMTDLNLRPEAHLDGRSFMKVLKGKQIDQSDRPVFWHSPVPRPVSTRDRANTTVRLGDYKLLDFYEENKVELYNIEDDIGETTDLSGTMPEKRDELLQLIVNWRKEVNAFVKKNKNNKNVDDY
jgi:arylsulfatase A-like enzyme